MTTTNETSALGDVFDRTFRSLTGRADVRMGKPSTVQTIHPVLELTQGFTIQTARVADRGDKPRRGDDYKPRAGYVVFITKADKDGLVRIALPYQVTDLILSQREALATANRRQAAKVEAKRRKDAGILPGYMNSKGKKKGKRKTKKAATPAAE